MPLVDEEFCGSCHVMEFQVDTYMNSAHKINANCADCHVPHHLVRGSVDKAWTGFMDFVGVVKNHDPYDIHASEHAKRIIQENCLRCHEGLTREIGDTSHDGGMYCFNCHRSTPHATKPNMDSYQLGYLDHGQAAPESLQKTAFAAQRAEMKEGAPDEASND